MLCTDIDLQGRAVTRDARLANSRNLRKLLKIVTEAFRDPGDPAKFARRLNLDTSRLPAHGAIRDGWENLFFLADDSQVKGMFQNLINELIEEAENTHHHASLVDWDRRSGIADLNRAAKECQKYLRQVLDKSDPLATEASLVGLSSVLKEMGQLLARNDLIREHFGSLSDAQRITRRARTSVRRALSAVDHMLGGVQSAEGIIQRFPSSTRPESTFESEFSIKGRLLDQRVVVDESVSDVITVLLAAWPHLLE
jgi:hypothetical protein